MKREFRCTRPKIYSDPNCSGYKDVTARQGHYIDAESVEDARSKMKEKFPGEKIDVETWDTYPRKLYREGSEEVEEVRGHG